EETPSAPQIAERTPAAQPEEAQVTEAEAPAIPAPSPPPPEVLEETPSAPQIAERTPAAQPEEAQVTEAEAPAIPAPSPPPPEVLEETPSAPQIAERTPAAQPLMEGQALRLAFDVDSANLPEAAKADLEALATRLAQEEDLRVQLLAYASGTEQGASQARRLSLSRALAVRSYLIEQGVRSTRMDVRALGDKSEETPADRVDLVLVIR
ncbi:MAG: OmpA family protein, partial [Alphaproteobacteria bacterium]